MYKVTLENKGEMMRVNGEMFNWMICMLCNQMMF